MKSSFIVFSLFIAAFVSPYLLMSHTLPYSQPYEEFCPPNVDEEVWCFSFSITVGYEGYGSVTAGVSSCCPNIAVCGFDVDYGFVTIDGENFTVDSFQDVGTVFVANVDAITSLDQITEFSVTSSSIENGKTIRTGVNSIDKSNPGWSLPVAVVDSQ